MGFLTSPADLLDFSTETVDGDDEVEGQRSTIAAFKLLRCRRQDRSEFIALDPKDSEFHRPGSVEEEEAGAFPVADTSDVDTVTDHSTDDFKHRSPTSGLEHSPIRGSFVGGLKIPVQARSKNRRGRRRDIAIKELCQLNSTECESSKLESRMTKKKTSTGRKCRHCGVEKTPQWRAGPLGPRTLCNACGVRYKSGRLMPEYRPAGSPTFSTELHSNSHRKVMEMRRTKE